MRELKCNNCGGTDIIMKANGKFLCDSCGVTYTKDQIEKMRVQIYGKVEVEGIATLERLFANAETFKKLGEIGKAYEIFTKITNEYPEDYRGWHGVASYYLAKNQLPPKNILKILKQTAPEIAYKDIRSNVNTICDYSIKNITLKLSSVTNYYRYLEGIANSMDILSGSSSYGCFFYFFLFFSIVGIIPFLIIIVFSTKKIKEIEKKYPYEYFIIANFLQERGLTDPITAKPYSPEQNKNVSLIFRSLEKDLINQISALEQLKKENNELIKNHIPPKQPVAKAPNIEEIEKLTQLRKKGFITEKEFTIRAQNLELGSTSSKGKEKTSEGEIEWNSYTIEE